MDILLSVPDSTSAEVRGGQAHQVSSVLQVTLSRHVMLYKGSRVQMQTARVPQQT